MTDSTDTNFLELLMDGPMVIDGMNRHATAAKVKPGLSLRVRLETVEDPGDGVFSEGEELRWVLHFGHLNHDLGRLNRIAVHDWGVGFDPLKGAFGGGFVAGDDVCDSLEGSSAEVGSEGARGDGDDVDSERLQFAAKGLGDAFEGVFAACVETETGWGSVSDDARNVEDRAGVLGSHHGDDVAKDPDLAEDVGVVLLVEVGVGDFFNRSADAESSVVDEDVDAAEFLDGCLNGAGDIAFLGDVKREDEGFVFELSKNFWLSGGGDDFRARFDELLGEDSAEAR